MLYMKEIEKGGHEAFGIGVEAGRAVDEIALENEIPEPGDEERHHQTGSCPIASRLKSDVFENMPAFEHNVQDFRARRVQDEVSDPDQSVLHHDGLP